MSQHHAASAGFGKANLSYLFHSLVCLAVMFGVRLLPPSPPLTAQGMALISIFLGVLYGWIFIEIIWPSIAGMLALALIGGLSPQQVLAQSFGSPTVVMMFFIFVFCAAINHYGLSKQISLWVITRKFAAGRPWLFTYLFFLSVMLLGGLTSASPAILIGWSILYGICDVCGYRKGDAYPKMMVFGVVYAALVGMSLIPFKQLALTVMGTYESISGTHIAYAGYMATSLVICLLCSLLFLLFGRCVLRPDVAALKNFNAAALGNGDEITFSGSQKTVLGFLCALVVLLLIPAFLPEDMLLVRLLKGIGNTGICMLVIAVMAAMRINGRPFLPFRDMAGGVAWGIIFILALVQPLSAAMAAPESGITPFFMSLLQPVFGSGSPMFFVVCMGALALCLCQFINNGAVGAMLMPVIFSYCSNNGTNPVPAVVMVVMSVHLAFLTPAASSSAALLHGNEWTTGRDILKTVPAIMALSWLIMCASVLTLSAVFF